MRWDNFIKSTPHAFWESRGVPGVQLLTSQKKSREGWQHPPHPSSLPCTHLSFQSAEEKWARTYSGPGCWFHSLRFQPLGYTGVWAGLQKGWFYSCFLPWKWHLWKDGCWQICVHPSRWVRTGQKEWSVEMEDLGSVMYNVQSVHLPLPSFCLCVSICSVTQSVLTLWGSMDCSPPGSSVLLVSAQGK